jgi:antitoxin (DNA-binding transcriptional repressor) of toxin-antitoxin stability system
MWSYSLMSSTGGDAVHQKALSVAQAKATLSAAIPDVEAATAVLITRHGRPVAALVRPQDVAAIERLRASGPAGGLARVAGGWKGSANLVAAITSARRRSRARQAASD